MILIYKLSIQDDLGLLGIWSSKLIAELAILLANTAIIENKDWGVIAKDLAQKRNIEENKAIEYHNNSDIYQK